MTKYIWSYFLVKHIPIIIVLFAKMTSHKWNSKGFPFRKKEIKKDIFGTQKNVAAFTLKKIR